MEAKELLSVTSGLVSFLFWDFSNQRNVMVRSSLWVCDVSDWHGGWCNRLLHCWMWTPLTEGALMDNDSDSYSVMRSHGLKTLDGAGESKRKTGSGKVKDGVNGFLFLGEGI